MARGVGVCCVWQDEGVEAWGGHGHGGLRSRLVDLCAREDEAGDDQGGDGGGHRKVGVGEVPRSVVLCSPRRVFEVLVHGLDRVEHQDECA